MNAILASAAAHPALVHLADVDDDKVTPGLLGFVVFAALGAAVWLLMKSMNKQFKKVNFEVERDDEPAARSADSAEPPAARPADSAEPPASSGVASGGAAGSGSGGLSSEG